MPKLIPIKPKKFIKILLWLGFKKRDAEGSHVFFNHPDGRTTVVSMHDSSFRKILNDVCLSVEEYDKLRK